MADAHAHDVKKEVRGYVGVFIALAALTALTVFASYLDVSRTMHIVIAMFIAVVKGSLVGMFFMHLISEKKLIYWTLYLTAIFFVALMLLPLYSRMERFVQ
jgi:cytochrome c oxidase subunit 4